MNDDTEDVLDDWDENYSKSEELNSKPSGHVIKMAECKGIVCLHCGSREEFDPGITVSEYCHRVYNFSIFHRDCSEQNEKP